VIFARNIQYFLFFWRYLDILIAYDDVGNIDRLFNNQYLFLSWGVSITYFFASFFPVGKVVEFSTNTLFFIITSYHTTSLFIFSGFFWGIFLRFEQFLLNGISFGAIGKQIYIIILLVFFDKNIWLLVFYLSWYRHYVICFLYILFRQRCIKCLPFIVLLSVSAVCRK